MNSCNPNNISLDANEIAMLVYSDDEIDAEYKNSLLSSFDLLDIKTYFEMLLLVTTEGMKTFFGDQNMQVDVGKITENNIMIINNHLKKINVKVIINTYTKEELNRLNIQSYNDYLNKNNLTKINNLNLTKLNYIIQRGDFIVISFEKI